MSLNKKYRIWCREPDDLGWKETDWTNVAPTTCPNNAAHLVNTNSVQLLYKRNVYVSMTLEQAYTEEDEYTHVASIKYAGSDSVGPLDKIVFTGYKTNGASSYSVKILDLGNGMTVCEQSFTNTNPQELIFDVINYDSADDTIFNILLKVNGGTEDDSASLTNVTMYTVQNV